ncbi:MAG: hypothetical protein KGP01_00255 [Actinomycetales bacterium]|nr:hypothetical protein [Actinomycetales bacterium]
MAACVTLTGCGPSPAFTANRAKSRDIVTAVADAAPKGYVAGAVFGGEWPNEGRGPNLWVNIKRSGVAIDAATECRRVREWAVRLGAMRYQDGNDGSNPVLPIAGHEEQAQETCMKWWRPALTATVDSGGPVLIYTGTYSREGQALGPFSIEANAGVGAVAGQASLRQWVNMFVTTGFE